MQVEVIKPGLYKTSHNGIGGLSSEIVLKYTLEAIWLDW